MPVARFQLPDGRVARFEVPEGTTPEQAQSMIQSELLKTNQTVSPELPQPRTAAPEGIPTTRKEPNWWQKIRPFVAPTVEALGAGGGALLGGGAGTVLAPGPGTAAGAVGGAGLGYGIAKEALELADVYLGDKQPRRGTELVFEPVKNVLEGATYEVGGRVAAPYVAKAIGKTADVLRFSGNKANKLAKSALGADLDETLNILRSASPGSNVSEITAKIKNPAWQALIRDSLERTPEGAQYLNKFAAMSHDEGVNALAKLAGGSTAADVKTAIKLAKQNVRATTTPLRQAALSRADLGQEVARLETLSESLGEQAAKKVQEVRRLMELGDLAKATATLNVINKNLPTAAARYTYTGELAQMADKWASNAAAGSLDIGAAAREAKRSADVLRSAGISPLNSQQITSTFDSVLSNPEFAGNDLIKGSIKNISNDIAQWTSVEGIIPATALDAIRKNSVNAAIQTLRPGMDATSQRKLATQVLTEIKPVIDDAIETAGGVGYKEYLKEHTRLSQEVAKQKLTGKALDLWKFDKDQFVKLVQNESPDVVEKILGPGNYDIAVELSEKTLSTLRKQADKRLSELLVDKQVSDGRKALATLVQLNSKKIRLPSWLNFWASATNKGIGDIEEQIGKKTMSLLSKSFQSPEGTLSLLDRLPTVERNRVLSIIANPTAKVQSAITGASAMTGNTINRLSEQSNENALAQ